jgi:hypothetical protein
VTRAEALAIVADPESGFNKGTYEWGEMRDLVLALAQDGEPPGALRGLPQGRMGVEAARWRTVAEELLSWRPTFATGSIGATWGIQPPYTQQLLEFHRASQRLAAAVDKAGQVMGAPQTALTSDETWCMDCLLSSPQSGAQAPHTTS